MEGPDTLADHCRYPFDPESEKHANHMTEEIPNSVFQLNNPIKNHQEDAISVVTHR